MRRSSSNDGSVGVPSKDPNARDPWDGDGWRALFDEEGDILGDGGWGVIRRVRRRTTHELYALKEPIRDDAEVRSRFKREIEIQKKVRHRHVMPVVEHDPEFGWFTMPIADRTLRAAAPEMIADSLATVLLHVARGLEAAHALGVIHRDIKPSNILACSVGEPELPDWVLGDFGVVRRPDGENTTLNTAQALGTRGFIAPEVLLGTHGSITPLADIYSLGRTIVWATTGTWPDGIVPIEARWPWATLAGQMTEFEPGRRPQSMGAIITGISSVLSALRAQRARGWGKTKAPAFSTGEEKLLALVFDHGSESERGGDEIVVTMSELTRHCATRAELRIGIRRLVKLGYIAEGWTDGEFAPVRTYGPTALAWEWATRNETRIANLLRPPPDPLAVPDDDIPF